MGGIRHIVMAKAWAGVLVFLFAISLYDDARIFLTPERHDSWGFRKDMKYKQGGLVVENDAPDKGVWLSSQMLRLEERGRPNWWVTGLTALSLIQILRHLGKARREAVKVVRERR